MSNFALAIEKIGSLAQLNRAFDYGSKGYRFESYASHKNGDSLTISVFCLYILRCLLFCFLRFYVVLSSNVADKAVLLFLYNMFVCQNGIIWVWHLFCDFISEISNQNR